MFVSGSGSVLDDSYQVSFHVAKRFQRRRFLEIGHPEKKIAMAPIGQTLWLPLAILVCFLLFAS
jgi:hypothetical protein